MSTRGAVPDDVLDRLRAICASLPGAAEEDAWTGVRWRVDTATIVHAVAIDEGWPPAYAAAAGTPGPACVITVRCPGDELAALTAAPGPYFRPVWGTRWRPPVLGVRIEADTDWEQVSQLVADSHRLLVPRRRRPRSTTTDADGER